MRTTYPLSLSEPTISRHLNLPEQRGLVHQVKSTAQIDNWRSVQSSSGINVKEPRFDTQNIRCNLLNLIPSYGVYTIYQGLAFSEEMATTYGRAPTNNESKVFVANDGYAIANANESKDNIIGVERPRLVTYDETFGNPAHQEIVGVATGATKVRRGLKGLLVVSEPDTTNKRVWVIRHFDATEATDLYLVEPKEDVVYPHNEGFVDGVIGYIHQWNQTTCAYVKDTGTEIKIFDPSGWNLVLPKEPVFARKITQYCLVGESLVEKVRYEIIGSHGLYRKTQVPKVSSGSQRLKVAECGETETVNIVNTVPDTFTLDINIDHGPHNPLFELDEPIAYYDRQEEQFYINPYDPPESATTIAGANNCGTSPVTVSGGIFYEDRQDIDCETTDLRSNTWPVTNPYALAFRLGDQLELRRDVKEQEYVIVQAEVRSKSILNNLSINDCSIGFTIDKIYGYDCAESTGSTGITMTAVEAITSVAHTSCGLVFGTAIFCVLSPSAGAGYVISGNTATIISNVTVDQHPTTKDCNLVFDKKTVCILGSITDIADTTIDFVQQKVVTDIGEVIVTGENPSDCIVVSTNTISVLCIKDVADTETELFCFTDCTTTAMAAMGVNDAPAIPDDLEPTEIEKEHSKSRKQVKQDNLPGPERPDTTQILLNFLKQLAEKTGVELPKEIQEMIK